ncbi:MAG TPA: hypothetical protein PKM88_07640 [bacterium]|nr:hypothetical protein [bacterium]
MKHLLIRLRDEVHQFINTAYRHQHNTTMLRSTLEDVPKIGAVRAKKMLARYSLAELATLPAAELAAATATPLAVVMTMQAMLGETQGEPRKEPLPDVVAAAAEPVRTAAPENQVPHA